MKPVVVFINSAKQPAGRNAQKNTENALRSRPRAQPGVRPPTPPKTPGFNETTTGFKFLLQKTRETAIFGPSFTETLKKKWEVSP